MNTAHGNKLIAKFLRLKYLGKNVNNFEGDVFDCTELSSSTRNIFIQTPLLYCNTQTMKFHKSWNWIMPVAGKIISRTNAKIIVGGKNDRKSFYVKENTVEAYYKAVIQYIENIKY